MESIWVVAKSVEDVVQSTMQGEDVFRNHVGQASVLRLVPNILDRIKVRRVRRKPFHVKPSGAVRQKTSSSRTMSRQAIPHQNDRPTQVMMNLAHELNEIGRSRVMVQQFIVQAQSRGPRRSRHGGNRRDPIAPIPRALDRRAAFWRPHASSQRLEQVAAFVEKNQASLPFEALFLVAARFRDAIERSGPRFVHERGVPASADSNLDGAAIAARTRDGNRRGTGAGSCLAPRGRSNRLARIPNDACPATMPPSVLPAAAWRVLAIVPDAAWTATCCHASRPSSNVVPKRRWNQLPRPLPSTTCPARKAWPRSFDELRAFLGFLVVSCRNYNGLAISFH